MKREKTVRFMQLRMKKSFWEKISFPIDNPVDTGSAGVYEVTYTATAEDGQTSSVRLIVCVNE